MSGLRVDSDFFTDFEKNLLHHNLIFVEGGEYDMGGSLDKPIHRVKVSSFYIGEFPVVQALWETIMGNNPSKFKGPNKPVESVSWNDIKEFLERFNNETGREYRLPTEAEWEFSAKGGLYTEGYIYAGSDKLEQVGQFLDNNEIWSTSEVGQKLPNEIGLFDISGNVWEWCEDWYDQNYYQDCFQLGVLTNPLGPKLGISRVIRGGGWINRAQSCQIVRRDDSLPDARLSHLGFRLVVSA